MKNKNLSTKENKKYVYVIGRRKRATARLKLFAEGQGLITKNNRNIDRPNKVWLEPLDLVGLSGKVDLSIAVIGGGKTGQSEAIRLAVARALIKLDDSLKTTLRKHGFLTRDPREKERKKPGLKGARRAPQWQKR